MRSPATASAGAEVMNQERKRRKKVVSHMEIRKGAKGGHVIVHHHSSDHPSETFPFGVGEGGEAHRHIAKVMQMPLEAAARKAATDGASESTDSGEEEPEETEE